MSAPSGPVDQDDPVVVVYQDVPLVKIAVTEPTLQPVIAGGVERQVPGKVSEVVPL